MEKLVEYEVLIRKDHVLKCKTAQSLKELKKEHKELGYKLVSYNGKKLLSSFFHGFLLNYRR